MRSEGSNLLSLPQVPSLTQSLWPQLFFALVSPSNWRDKICAREVFAASGSWSRDIHHRRAECERGVAVCQKRADKNNRARWHRQIKTQSARATRRPYANRRQTLIEICHKTQRTARINAAELNISLGRSSSWRNQLLYRDRTQLSTKTSITGWFRPIHGIAAARSPNRIASENKFIHCVLPPGNI